MSKDELGDRMKGYEAVETGRRLDLNLPVVARLDGRGFSKFTRNMERPFDAGMTRAMQRTAAELVDRTHALISYTQSDEITLVFERFDAEGSIFFDGKIQKLVSVLAGLASARFAREVAITFPADVDRYPHFDCRVFNVPSREEAANAVLWRVLDARKNAINQVAFEYISHKELQGVGSGVKVELLKGLGVEFSAFPVENRRGTFLRRVTRLRMLTPQELLRIPTAYRPTEPVERSSVEVLDMPPFWYLGNRAEVIFEGAEPLIRDQVPA